MSSSLLLIIVTTITIINLILIIFLGNIVTKNFKLTLSKDGIPLSNQLPLKIEDFTIENKYTAFLCIDISCLACQKIIRYLYSTDNINKSKLKLIYLSPKEETLRYLIENNYKKDKYEFTFMNIEDLYIKSKPFLYVTTDDGTVIDKYVVSNPKSITNII